MRARLAVLASGGGTNLQAILDYFDALGDARAADVVLVASDRPGAGALDRAHARGIARATLRTKTNPGGVPLADALRTAQVDYVVLAGYLRLIPGDVVRAYANRIVNVHPALLPQFGGEGMYGRHVHEAVIAARAAQSGPTVHFVDEQFDHGAVIAQWAIPVRAGDTAETLAARVLRVEHALYPRVVQALAAGRVKPGGPAVRGPAAPYGAVDPDDTQLGEDIDDALGL
ncbi:MAG TPA: phosphoribosylglycinamide formyltransferase [Gemmatimonadaceae bacterium]|nr:phosphoribosylglycinamide formyltransferase [Gemmatimonadaceae bacterium]